MEPVLRQCVRQRELLEHHRREPVQQQHHRVVGPGDMRVRERHRAHVVGGELQCVGEAGAARDQGAVGVQDALGVRGGARGPVDPADLLARRGCGGGGRIAGSPSGEILVRLEDLRRVGEFGRDPLGHRGVVEAAPHPRHGEERGPRLPQREPHLAVPVEGDDRRLYGPEPGQGEGEQGRLQPGRQLPGHHAARPYAHPVQPGGDPFGAVPQPAEGQGAVPLEQDRAVGGEGGSAFDEFPEGAGVAQGVGGRGHVVHGGHSGPSELTASQIMRRA
ncbi:hypothetical protein SMICM17S_03882 [Streptomyces microflavus]